MFDGDGDRASVPDVAVPGLPPVEPDGDVGDLSEAAELSREDVSGHLLSVMRWPGAVSMVCRRCGADSVGNTYREAREHLAAECEGMSG